MERAELASILHGVAASPGVSRVQVSEADPQGFMTVFANAVADDVEVFLCDPQWGEIEQRQLTALLQSPPALPNPNPAPHSSSRFAWLMIPTGGSGGRLKFARHDQHTVAAAVRGFTEHFGLARVNAMGLLPLHHVSGFMAWMRCALTGGEYRHLDWKAVEQGILPELPPKPDGWVLSLVATQLERLLRRAPARQWLAQFRIVFLGGGPAWPELLEQAAALRLPLSPGYGMTETAAMITALRPEEFLAGARSCGRALPHAQVRLAPDGTILVMGRSVFRGYYPEMRPENGFLTTDTGRLDEQGQLHVMGRRDDIIITGGEKVNPSEVEAVLRGPGGLTDVVVLGLPDAEWGQIVVAAYPASSQADPVKFAQLTAQLTPAKRPKRFIPLESWPLTGAGKVNRAEVMRLLGEKTTENTK